MKALLALPVAVTLLAAACAGQPAPAVCLDVAMEGVADLGFPVVIPVGTEPLVGGGAFASATQVGPYRGTLASVVTAQDVDAEGATRLSLVHYFEEEGRGDSFWTEDAAVCTPVAGAPASCDVVTDMRVAGGTGKFAGLEGTLRNKGRITFTDPSFQTSPYGSLSYHTTGRICGGGL